jgi:phosphate starvation-inducible PhoH-like protein
MEKTIVLETHTAIGVYGKNNGNIELLTHIYPKLKITARGNEVKVVGEDSEVELFEQRFQLLQIHFDRFGKVTETDVLNITSAEDDSFYRLDKGNINSEILLHGREGRIIKAITPNQKKMVESAEHNDMLFAIGPAGTGKTYTAVALAVRALKNKQVRRIILTRPAVEAGENLGFLPGDLKDKLDPYLQPLYDALWDMMPMQKLLSYMEDKTIEIAPLAFMRGRTLTNAVIILDEAQNTTTMQMKMFLTRLGENSRMIVTGDPSQVDLPTGQTSGLADATRLLNGVEGIAQVIFTAEDVIRHELVARIVAAYEGSLPRPAADNP